MKDSFVTAFAPASIGNLGVGFDMLGLAIEGAGDRVDARKTSKAGVSILEVRGPDKKIHPVLGNDPRSNTAAIAAAALWSAHGDGGVELVIHKGIPLQSGMGSSAASAVAGAVAANALLEEPLELAALLPYAMEGEKFASGGIHADNVGPSLLGGLVFCPTTLLPEIVSLPLPTGIVSVLVHPELEVNTAESRKGLATRYTMQQWLEQQGYLAGFIAACASNDHTLLAASLRDVIIEPQRAKSVAHFDNVKSAALRAGALGCSLSGSGPSVFALCAEERASGIADSMQEVWRQSAIDSQCWVSPLCAHGASLES